MRIRTRWPGSTMGAPTSSSKHLAPACHDRPAAIDRGGMMTTTNSFDEAVEAIIHGDEVTLDRILRAEPTLVRLRASAPHGATLLHYVAANGVERERQLSPK